MRILSLDPGRKCGWALREIDGSMTSGVWDLRVEKGRSWETPFQDLRRRILWASGPPDLIAYEISINKYPNSMLVYLSIVETIKDTGIEFKGYHWNTIKKYATGKGNASKEQMMAAAHRKWGSPGIGIDEGIDHNEADARWVAEYAASQIGATSDA